MTAIRYLVAKDVRILVRSPLLVGALVVYPVLLALLVGLVARFSAERPRVAFVDEDGIPSTVTVGGREFAVGRLFAQADEEVDLVPLERREADRRLASGDVVAILVVPQGFVSRLRGMTESPTLTLRLGRGRLAGRVERETQALVYRLNRRLQGAYIDANLEYVRLLREGGTGTFLGNDFDVIGLERAGRALAELERSTDDPAVARQAAELGTFVDEALLALEQSGETLRATANPIELETGDEGRRESLLSAELQANALALTLALVCTLLAASAIAAERDENAIRRLARGLVRLVELVAAKIALSVLVAVVLGVALATLFGGAVTLAGSHALQPWDRLPLLLAALVLAGAAFGALGAMLGTLAREARTAALLALLVALPIVLLGLLPETTVEPAAWLSNVFPFVHAARLFEGSLSDVDTWGETAKRSAWLAGLAGAYAVAARAGMHRLLTCA